MGGLLGVNAERDRDDRDDRDDDDDDALAGDTGGDDDTRGRSPRV